MKRPDWERLRYVDQLWRRRNRREAQRSANQRRTAAARQKAVRPIRPNVRVHAPTKFDLGNWKAREELINFINRIHEHLDRGSRVQIVFDATKELRAHATLFFVATIERLLPRYPGKIGCNYPVDNIIEQVFQHVGLLQKLGNSPRTTITADNVRHWHYREGTTTDLTGLVALFGDLAKQLGGDTSSGLFDSVSEAVTNVVQHAYDGTPEDKTDEARWWLFAQMQNGKLDLAICDLGIGIPESIRSKPELATVLPNLIRRLHHRVASGLIEVAVESTRSRTRLPHRGKGLPEMLAFSKRGVVGGFFITSHQGYFIYNANYGTEVARDFSPPLAGTLISWTLPLPEPSA